MKLSLLLIAFCSLVTGPAWTQDSLSRARQMEASGNSAAALQALSEAASRSGASESDLAAYAHFLDQYGGDGAREAYAKLIANTTDPQRKQSALRRLVLLDLASGDSSRPDARRRASSVSGAGARNRSNPVTQSAASFCNAAQGCAGVRARNWPNRLNRNRPIGNGARDAQNPASAASKAAMSCPSANRNGGFNVP
jgi:hypothetical protein